MKKILLSFTFVLLITTSIFSLLPINKEEIKGANRIIEESKLKKDISKILYDFWGLDVYNDITKLEINNLKKINSIFEKYNMENPTLNSENGSFKSLYVKKLYNDFKDKSQISEFESLRLAATLEDLFIDDLNSLLEFTTNSDIKDLYIDLRYNSISQIRALNLILRKKYKTDYQSQFLSPQDLKAILLN